MFTLTNDETFEAFISEMKREALPLTEGTSEYVHISVYQASIWLIRMIAPISSGKQTIFVNGKRNLPRQPNAEFSRSLPNPLYGLITKTESRRLGVE
jgi:hypothetical protein